MRLLAVVEDSVKDILVQGLECEIDAYTDWQSVDFDRFRGYGHVIVSGKCVEGGTDPYFVRGVASAIRYFALPAVFIDVSFNVGNLLARVYPQIKVVSFSGDREQLLLQLRTCAPALFRQNVAFMGNTGSAMANAWRFEEKSGVGAGLTSLESGPSRAAVPMSGNAIPTSQRRLSGVKDTRPTLGELNGQRQISKSIDEIMKRSVSSSFGPVSSIPLGMKASSLGGEKRKLSQEFVTHPSFRKEGLGNGRAPEHVSEIDFSISDISGISAISGISDISGSEEISALEKALSNVTSQKGDHLARSASGPVLTDNKSVSPVSSRSGRALRSDASRSVNPEDERAASTLVVHRTLSEVTSGAVEFGTLIRVVHTLTQLRQTGTLEAVNDTRVVKLEFRNGKTFSSQSAGLILSALNWTAGDYTFNSSQMLSATAKPLDIYQLVGQAVHEQLPLNPILRALEQEFNSYIALTTSFNPSNHANGVSRWWLRCDGSCQLSEIMMASAAEMESISRDIYQAWLCDELCFLKNATTQRVRVEYDAKPVRAGVDVRSEMNKTLDSADNSHLNGIRLELQKVRASFDTEDGYTILGLRPGCGMKALDDAYYAWINRYHTDRFVRFKDPSFIKIANELLVLMNSTYTKLAKVERNGVATTRATEEARRRIQQQNDPSGIPNVSSRIGAGRARISTITSYNEKVSNEQLRSISSELRSIEQVRADNHAKRPPIRPASISTLNDGPAFGAGTQQSAYLKMSDVLARKRAQTQELLERRRAQSRELNDRRAPESRLDAAPAKPHTWAAASVTPAQHFQTAKKKLTLGLAQEALTSLQCAVDAEPENQEYQVYHAYASFLVEPHKREECLQRIVKVYEEIKGQYATLRGATPEEKAFLFAPCYFIAKIYIASEKYEEASEFLKLAAKINPSDIDTQRCIRYIAMQSEKKAQEQQKPKGLFSMFKERFGKGQ